MPTLMTGAPRTQLKEATIDSGSSTATAYGCLVFGSPKGPITPQFNSSWAGWVSNYGGSFLDWSFAGISAKAYLNNGPGIWSYRVTSDASYASMFVLYDQQTDAAPIISPIQVLSVGMFPDNNEGVSGFTIKTEDASSFPASTVTINVSVTGKITKTYELTASLSATTSRSSWLAPIAGAIANAFNTDSAMQALFPNGSCGQGPTLSDSYFVYFAQGLIVTATLSGQTGQSASIVYDPFIQIYSRDPTGTYANNYYGISTSNYSTGLPQVTTVYFNEDIASDQTVSLQVKASSGDYSVVIPYTESSSNTVGLIAATISNLYFDGIHLTAVASSYSGTGDNNYITITSSIAGTGTFTIASQDDLSYTISSQAAGRNDPETFQIQTWVVNNTNTALETYTVSLNSQVDASGNQQEITTVLEGASSAPASNYIRAYICNATDGYQPSYNGLVTPIANAAAIHWLGGGSDGTIPSNGQIAEAWEVFEDTETYSVNLLINSGYTDPSVHVAMANVADNRMDAIAVLDLPSSYVTAQDAANYRNNSINTISTRAALYTPYLKTVDPATYKTVMAPPSGFVADRFVYTRNNYGNYYSPAGTKYGVVANVTDVAVNYSDLGDRDILDAAQINYIRKLNGAIVIDNDRTMIDNNGMLSSLNVRIMVNDIESYAASVADQYKFELDNPASWAAIELKLQKYVDIYINAGALSAGVVVCDATNNTAAYQDNAQINVNIYLIPVRATRYIYVGVGIGTNSLGISELESSGIV